MAAKAWEKVAELEPENAMVLETLAGIHRKMQSHRPLAAVMKRQIELDKSVSRQVNLLFELAKLAEDSLADRELAIECLQGVLKRKPDDANAIKALDAVLASSEHYPELASLIEREIKLADDAGAVEEAAELTVRLGRLKLSRLQDPRRALELFQEVLRRRANHAAALGALEEMARSDHPLRGEAAAVLEPLFATSGEYLKLVQMLESRISSEAQPQERARSLCKVSELYSGSLKNWEMAFLSAARALREMPDYEEALTLCLKTVEPAGTAEELVALLSEIAVKASHDRARASIYAALAKVQDGSGDPEQAAVSWQKLLDLQPSNREALENVGRLFKQMGKAKELLEVLRRQISTTEDGAAKASLLFQIGALQQDHLRDDVGALTTFRRLLELQPEAEPVLERLEQLCQKLERWPELADVWGKRVQIQGKSATADLKFRLATLRELRLMDRFGALDIYTEILAADPAHAGALGRLEEIAAADPQNQAVAAVLLNAVRANGDRPKLLQILEAQVPLLSDLRQRKTALIELAELREKEGAPELAFLAYWRAFKEDPNDLELRRRLEATAELAKTYDELCSAYEDQLPRIAEASDAAQLCLSLAEMLDQRIQDPSRAIVFYEKARQLSPEAVPKALLALDRLYTQLDQPKELADVLEGLAEQSSDPQEKVSVLFRLGQLAQNKLEDSLRATAAYERVLVLDKTHLASARSLEHIYQAAGQQEKLYAILKHQRDLGTGREKERALSRMAQVASEGLSDAESSIDHYRELLAKNPRHETAFGALEQLLEKAERFPELKDLLSNQLHQILDPRELVRVNARLGQVLFEKLKQPEAAIEPLKATLDRDPRHKPSLETLRAIYESLGRNDELVAVLRRLVPLQESTEGVKELRIRLAELLAQLGRKEEALDASRRALEIEPHRAAELGRLQGIFSSFKAFAEAVRVIELRSAIELGLEDRERAIASLFEIADLWSGPAGKPESAGGALEKVLEIDPSNRPAYERAKELYAKQKDWRPYAQLIDRYLPHLVTEEEKILALRELARVQELKLGQKDVAFLATCRALQLNPADEAIRGEAERLAEDTQSHEALAAVYQEVAEGLPHGPLAERTYLVLAKVYDRRLDDPDSAETALRKVLESDPTNEMALDALAEMFLRRTRYKDYVIALEQKLEATSSIDGRKPILREIARIYDQHLSDPQEAVGALLRALGLEPDEETLDLLIALYRRQKAWPEVANTLIRAGGLASTDQKRAQLQIDAAQVYERELNDEVGAIVAYREALEFEPKSSPALEALERLYTKTDQPSDLLAVYDRQLELAEDYRDQVKALFKSASIWESKFQNLPNADAAIERILSIDSQNLPAIKTLARLRRAQGRWEELVPVIERQVQLSNSPQEQAELCVGMGDLFHQQLKQADRAATAYHRALDLDPQSRPAMHALGLLYERSGNWSFALEMLQREAEVSGSTPESVDLHYRMGRINEDMLLDLPSAKGCYLEAVRLDPRYVPAIHALKTIYEREGDWTSYEGALIQEAESTDEPELKSKALIEVGRHYAEKKEDPKSATTWYQEALRLAPDSLEAAKPLADIYIASESWERAERMQEIVTAKLTQALAVANDNGLSHELCRQLYRLGYVSEKLAKKDKALAAYERAYQLDATYLPALEGLGNSLVHAGRLDDALKVFQTILIHHRDDLTDLEVVEIYWQLGDIHQSLQQLDRAQNHFEKALAIDPGHETSLRALISLADTAGRFDQSADYRQRLIQALDGDSKFDLCVELGSLAREKLADAHMAIDAYLAAHKIRPDSLMVMDGLYVLYRETRQGPKAAEMLEKMLARPELRQDKEKTKLVYFALGEIARDELGEIDRAVAAFNSALDLDPRFLSAFSALEALLVGQKQWKQLEANYVRMIHRLPKTPETHGSRMALWQALGDLYLRVLQQEDAALMAYQVVAAGLPEDAVTQETYAQLASRKAGNEDLALAAYRRAVVNTDNPGRVCSAFAELAARQKDYDSAYLAAQVVRDLIGKPGENEKEILGKLAPYAKQREVAQRGLTDPLWHQHLFHPKVRGPLGDLMGTLYEHAGYLYSLPLSQYQLNPKRHRIDVATAQEYQIHHYRYVARLLGMEAIDLYSPFLAATRERLAKRSKDPVPDPQVGVEICHTHPICLRVGGKFFSEHGQKEVYYWLGRTLALARPELALSQRMAPERLAAVLQAAISLSTDQFPFTVNSKLIETERQALTKALSEPARVSLDRAVRQYLDIAAPRDLVDFVEGAELTAVRTGLFVAGEPEPAKKMVLGESGSAYRLSTPSKIREMMVFALSEDLHALRIAVGTQLEVQTRRG
jgi:tetratricopeptide (TPR) repeat protein